MFNAPPNLPPLPEHMGEDLDDLREAWALTNQLHRDVDNLERLYKIVSHGYAGDPRTLRMQGQLTQEQYRDLVSLISEHHRDPGDPEIRSKGVVVADINEALLQKLIADSCQVILCYRGDTIVGVSLFNAPEACPQHLREVDNALGGDTNAAGTLILTSRSEQGSLVFPMLMNATMTAAAGAGATRIIGEVMSENERAIAAYAKYGGEIHPDKTRTRFAPSGKLATFVAVSIPIFTEAAAAPPSESSRQKEVATVPS